MVSAAGERDRFDYRRFRDSSGSGSLLLYSLLRSIDRSPNSLISLADQTVDSVYETRTKRKIKNTVRPVYRYRDVPSKCPRRKSRRRKSVFRPRTTAAGIRTSRCSRWWDSGSGRGSASRSARDGSGTLWTASTANGWTAGLGRTWTRRRRARQSRLRSRTPWRTFAGPSAKTPGRVLVGFRETFVFVLRNISRNSFMAFVEIFRGSFVKQAFHPPQRRFEHSQPIGAKIKKTTRPPTPFWFFASFEFRYDFSLWFFVIINDFIIEFL